MGTITVTLTMQRVDFVRLDDVEIRFMEDGVLRSLDLNEWKAYFPGCGDPVAYKRVSQNHEQVWQGVITDKLVNMANSAGFYFISGPTGHRRLEIERALLNLTATPSAYQNRYRPEVTEDDAEPPTVWTLIQFLSTLKNKCEEFASARVGIRHDRATTVTHSQYAPNPIPYRATVSNMASYSMEEDGIRRAWARGDIDTTEYRRLMDRFNEIIRTRQG